MNSLKVVKIGGNIVDNPTALEHFLVEFSKIDSSKILVHGGGKVATKLSAALGIQTQMIEGRRVTDAATIEVVTMVYAGGVNKSVVSQLNAIGVRAWGICGADAQIIPAHKRPVKSVDYGFVGDVEVESIDTAALSMLINGGFVPTVAPITSDKSGQLLNTNADTVAQSIAVAMSSLYSVELIYMFEMAGVMLDVNDDKSIIPVITPSLYSKLKDEGDIYGGMIPKIDNAYEAISCGVESVTITGSLECGSGTKICLDNE